MKFSSVISIQVFSIKNANPSFYSKCVEDTYFPLPSQFEMLLYHEKPFPKPLQLPCACKSQKCKHVKKFVGIFIIDAGIVYVLVVNISDFFEFF
jgi:hypothetical protein